MKVAVISGGDWPQFEKQLVSPIFRMATQLEEFISPPYQWNKVLRIQSALEKALFGGLHREEKAKDYKLIGEGD